MSPAGTGFRVAVVGGGANCEHDVSLASAAAAARALRDAGHRVAALTIDRRGRWCDDTGSEIGLPGAVALLQDCAAVLPLVHGPHGEDGTLAALCDLAGVPWIGSPLAAGAVAMDKQLTKLVAAAAGLRTARGTVVPRGVRVPVPADLPVVVKPVSAGSSHGVAVVRTAAELAPALEAAWALDERALVEELVVGREIDVAVLRRPDGSHLVAPALEILTPAAGIFDLATKYDGSARFLIPAPLSPPETARLEAAAIAAYVAIGCAGVARVDFFWTAEGPVLNEVNTAPGFTEHSQVPRMFAACGIAYPQLLDLLVRDALAALVAA